MKEPPPPFRVNQQYLGLLIQQINESVADISRALTYSWCSSQVEKKISHGPAQCSTLYASVQLDLYIVQN